MKFQLRNLPAMHPVPKKPEGTYKMNKETLETFLKKNKKKNEVSLQNLTPTEPNIQGADL